jgi:solute:Na+ symporter, SSS family
MADLTDRQRKILRLIDYGRGRMDYLIDAFGIDSTLLNQDVEYLEQNGYISRLGGTGYDFFSFILLPEGEAALPPRSPAELRLREDHLMPEGLSILRFVRDHPGCKFWEIVGGTGLAETETLSFLNYHVNETGYLRDTGLWRRRYWITPRGEQVQAKHATPVPA